VSILDGIGGLTVRLADPADAIDLAPRLRPWDLVECLAGGIEPATALMTPFANEHGPWTYAFEQDGRLIGIGGVTPIPLLFDPADIEAGHGGAIWFLGSEEIDHAGLGFMVLSRAWVRRALAEFPILVNMVPERCTATIRWLKWLGFDTEPAIVHLRGIRFVQFRMDRSDGPTSATAPR
jgi:hypothetical protein